MAEEHFLAAGEFPSESFFGSGLYAPLPPQPGLDIAACAAAMAHFGMLPWASELPLPSDSATTPTAAAHFDSALSSLVSSPAPASVHDDVAIGDLIGRLGGICSNNAASANNSCYSTPLSSPPRGASLAFRQGGCYPVLETAGGGRLSRVASSTSLGAAAPALESPADGETSPATAAGMTGPGVAQKRKAASGKGKTVAAVTNGSPKRPKVAGEGNEDAAAAAAEDKKPELEPFKDYIHVRARRGQATDSHSLAERVRREKISERMKLLQSLVPGCNKVTGKALMLDEIINYVQSLQRQVEFLSMKLSTMNAQPDVDAQYPPSDRDMVMMMHHQPATLGYPRQDAFSYGAGDPFATMHPTAVESCTSSALHPGAGGFGGWETTTGDHLHDNQHRLPSPPSHTGHAFHGK